MEHCAPDWQILVDLLVSEADGVLVYVSSACIAAGVPLTTALRHIKRLEAAGHIERRNDESDKRRVRMQLSSKMRHRLIDHLRNDTRIVVR